MKWVLKNKGEKVRARLVVREIKKAKSEDEKLEPSDVFSAMPPVESLKALVSHVMTERVDKRGRALVLTVFDVSRAHFYGVCERDVYVEPLAELRRPGLVAKLNKTMHGTKDASNAWQKLWGEHLDKELEVLHRSVRVISDDLMETEADLQSRTVQFSKESKQRCFGVGPCVVRIWRKIEKTSLKRSSVWHE